MLLIGQWTSMHSGVHTRYSTGRNSIDRYPTGTGLDTVKSERSVELLVGQPR